MQLTFEADIFYWRGPAPHHFVRVPDELGADIQSIAAAVTYGWGMIPATVQLGGTQWTTSLWPKDGGYIVPIKRAVQLAEGLDVDDTVEVTLTISG